MSKKILITEDNELSYRLAEYILTQAGYQVDWAKNGKECLQKVTQNRYDAVLMDLNLPELNGIETTCLLREQFTKEELPIIGISAELPELITEPVNQSGMNGQISKPYQSELLLGKLNALIGGNLDTTSHITIRQTLILSPLFQDPDLLKKSLPHLQHNARHLLTQMNQAMAECHRARLLELTHQLKGMVGNFSECGPFETICKLEQYVQSDKSNNDELQTLVDSIQLEINHFCHELDLRLKQE